MLEILWHRKTSKRRRSGDETPAQRWLSNHHIESVSSDTPLIKVEDLCKSFGSVPVLDHVNLDVCAGEELSVVGTSGCGKTVLTKHFNALLTPDSGRVTVCGVDLAEASEARLENIRKQIGYVFQGNALFASAISSTVYENVSLPLRRDPYDYPAANEGEIRQRVIHVLEEVGLGEELLDRSPSELSGGQRKRVAVARAIAASPLVIIYDEPTTGLDPESTKIVIELMDKLYRANCNTTIAITHEVKLMKALGRVVFMKDGKIYFDGTYEAFSGSDDPVIMSFLAAGEANRFRPNRWA